MEVDKQGRILLPNKLREYAQLIKDVALIGVGDRIEIWNQERWSQLEAEMDAAMDDIAEEMSDDLGIIL